MRLGLAFCAFFAIHVASACSCGIPSVDDAMFRADIVFRGTITRIEDHKAFFRVERVWKGKVSRTFAMPALRETSACIGFWPNHLEVGKDLLVFANRHKGGAYFTSICDRTRMSEDAGEDLRWLGKGSEPFK